MTNPISRLWQRGRLIFGFRQDTEQPDYRMIDTIGRVEIRSYGERLAADTVVDIPEGPAARSAGFRILADYIFGNNQGAQQIAMTAPVAQSPEASNEPEAIAMTAPVSQARTNAGWRVRFFLPRDLTLATAPRPNNDRVELARVAAETYAVCRFAGSRDALALQSQIELLEQALATSAWQATGSPAAWFYDPPWTLPFLRRNEVAVGVIKKTADRTAGLSP